MCGYVAIWGGQSQEGGGELGGGSLGVLSSGVGRRSMLGGLARRPVHW